MSGKGTPASTDLDHALAQLRGAARDSQPVAGLTHAFYRYPARFSPTLASTAIAEFSRPGDLVLDPYMGGGTSIIEAFVQGRRAVGCDLNSLAVFLTGVKCASLSEREVSAVVEWADRTVPTLKYSTPLADAEQTLCPHRTRNLEIAECRPLKKIIALGLESLGSLPTERTQAFARAVLLNTGQWALNGRRIAATAVEFREKLRLTTSRMIAALAELAAARRESGGRISGPLLIEDSAENLMRHAPFRSGAKADLVVTSPPYPGIHILYHRWQVDGRKESPAPYWIAGCQDGRGDAYYNFADRRSGDEAYFEQSLQTLKAIRAVTRPGAIMVQMLAFAEPRRQLPRYLATMSIAGFREIRRDRDLGYISHRRIWRDVPRRSWHARMKGKLESAREVVLVHIAE